jgi:hypothetical protein
MFDATKAAAELWDRLVSKGQTVHPAKVSIAADALAEAYRAGLEEAAKLVDGWHIKRGGYSILAEAIRARKGQKSLAYARDTGELPPADPAPQAPPTRKGNEESGGGE